MSPKISKNLQKISKKSPKNLQKISKHLYSTLGPTTFVVRVSSSSVVVKSRSLDKIPNDLRRRQTLQPQLHEVRQHPFFTISSSTLFRWWIPARRASSLADARDTFVSDQTTFDRARLSARPIGDSLVPLCSCSRTLSRFIFSYCFTLFEADSDNFLVYICTRRSAHDHFLTLFKWSFGRARLFQSDPNPV